MSSPRQQFEQSLPALAARSTLRWTMGLGGFLLGASVIRAVVFHDLSLSAVILHAGILLFIMMSVPRLLKRQRIGAAWIVLIVPQVGFLLIMLVLTRDPTLVAYINLLVLAPVLLFRQRWIAWSFGLLLLGVQISSFIAWTPHDQRWVGTVALNSLILLLGLVMINRLIMGLIERMDAESQQRQIAQLAQQLALNRQQYLEQQLALVTGLEHDLRQPLRSLHGYTRLLAEEVSDPDHTEMLDQIGLAGQRAESMLANLMDISSMRSAGYRVRPCLIDVPTLFHTLEQQTIGLIRYHRHDEIKLIIKPITSYIWADEGLIQRAVLNIVDNAVRHVPRSGVITLTCESANELTWISIGNSATHLPFMIAAYLQSDSDDQEIGGLGLGLRQVKETMLAHAGTIEVIQHDMLTIRLGFPPCTSSLLMI
ncbi:MAG: hypothetical protein KAX40_02490 [Herpetosiphon sp.]|nr:hypothetical protein [Herpetosiphon sp.]